MHKSLSIVVVLAVWLYGLACRAAEPANPDLTAEARAVLDYLTSLEGKATLAGVSGSGNADAAREVSGKYPAVLALDLSGWNSPPWGDSYNRVVQGAVDRAKAWWQDGGIVAMQLHWIHPSNPNGSAWRGKHGRKEASGPFDFSAALVPGTRTHQELMRDLEGHADYHETSLAKQDPGAGRGSRNPQSRHAGPGGPCLGLLPCMVGPGEEASGGMDQVHVQS